MRSRPLLVLVIALAVALVVVAVVQSVQGLRAGTVTAETAAPDLNRAYLPPIIRNAALSEQRLALRGTAEPESVVRVLADGRSLRQVATSEAGEWTLDIAVPPSRPAQLSVESYIGEDRVVGDDQLLYVPAPGAEDGISQRPLIALAVPGGPTRILQTPFGATLASELLSVASIDYDDAGGVILAGDASRQGRVRLSANLDSGRRLLGEAPLAPDGRWFFIALDAPPDRKAFTVSLVDTGGVLDTLAVDFVPLQPGESLRREPAVWQVRRELPGGGSQVSVVLTTPIAVPNDELDTPEAEDADG